MDVITLNENSVATILPVVAIVGVDAAVVLGLATGEKERKVVLIEMLVKLVEVKTSIKRIKNESCYSCSSSSGGLRYA